MRVTQQKIADHLGMAQKNASVFLRKLDFDWRVATLDEIRIAYIRKLRAQGASLQTKDGDLVMERVMTERVDRELKEFNLAERKAQLINLAQLEPAMVQMVSTWKAELLGFDDRLKVALDAAHGIDIDIRLINNFTLAGFNHLKRYDVAPSCDAGLT